MDRPDLDAVLSSHPHGTVVAVWAVPGASRTQIVGPHGTALRVRIAGPPEAGRANQLLVRELRSVLGTRVDLLSGATSRRKRLLARNSSRSEVLSALVAATSNG
jgi:uncharacterized protein (TIGR00251 family)